VIPISFAAIGLVTFLAGVFLAVISWRHTREQEHAWALRLQESQSLRMEAARKTADNATYAKSLERALAESNKQCKILRGILHEVKGQLQRSGDIKSVRNWFHDIYDRQV